MTLATDTGLNRKASLLNSLADITFVVIDFEALTPAGRPAEPVEVAAMVLALRDGQLAEQPRFSELIMAPADVPVTAFDTRITGITARMLAGARPASQVRCGAASPTTTGT